MATDHRKDGEVEKATKKRCLGDKREEGSGVGSWEQESVHLA